MYYCTMILSNILYCIIVVVFLTLGNIAYKWLQFRKYLNKVPGPPTYYILGNLPQIICPFDVLFNRIRKYAIDFYPVYRLWNGPKGAFNLIGPHDIEALISTMKHSMKSETYKPLHLWLNEGLLTSKGEKWQFRRKLLTPTFHFNILQQFLKIFTEYSEVLIKQLSDTEGNTVDIVPIVTQITLQTISESAMGIQLDQSQNSVEYIKSIYKIGEMIVYRICRPWLHEDWFYFMCPSGRQFKRVVNILHNFSRSVISERQKTFNDSYSTKSEVGSKKKLAMLDLLISLKRSGEPLNDEDIREEVDTFMFEGHDTTTASISFTLFAIANHPKIQENILKELNEVYGNSKRLPTHSDLMEMKYLDMVIKESLRMYPSVPFISRYTDEEFSIPSGYVIPAGSLVHVHIFDLHRNPSVFPNPEIFDPERFSLENSQTRHPFAYIPFSAGPRNCIGQKFAMLELKAMISEVVRNFEIVPIDTPSSIQFTVDLILRSKNGVKMKFVRRTQIQF